MEEKKSKNKKDKKLIDIIVMIILAVLVIAMSVFAATREASNQEIILMEIYKSAGPETSTTSMTHYYIYANTNTVEIRNSNPDGSNTSITKEISQDSINNLTIALNEYISQNPTINTSFYINERYTIEFNGKSITVPNPSVSTLLGYDSSEYVFYNTVEDFINNIDN